MNNTSQISQMQSQANQIQNQKFGKKRLDDFKIDKTFTNLNHGSYGYTPKSVLAYKEQLCDKMQFNTQKWFRIDMEILINQTRQFIANKVNAPVKNIFMVQNATDAFNGLAKSLKWKQGEIVLLPNTVYPSIRNTVEWLRDYWKIEILYVNFTIEDIQTPQSIQFKIQETVNTFPKKIKLAVFDHISSTPSIVFPIKSIQIFLEQKGIDLFVDGAHAICQVSIDMMDLQCDAYFSNLHKWAFTPKNAAFIYVSDKYLDIVRPSITGNFRGQGIQKEYFWTGTRDCTAYLCAQKGIQYFESFGQNEVKNYNCSIAYEGAKLMAKIWNTDLLIKDKRILAYMVCVVLPTKNFKLAQNVQDELLRYHNTYFPVSQIDGVVYCRVCGQIYNQLEDYKKAAQLFLEIMNEKLSQKEIPHHL